MQFLLLNVGIKIPDSAGKALPLGLIFLHNMRPKFKISNLTNLQDARYSAAVGFDLLSFSLARGSARKLPTNLVWNIANWLEGPEIILELNRESLPELEEVTFDYRYLSFPIEDWEPGLLEGSPAVILVADQGCEPEHLQKVIDEHEGEVKIELFLGEGADASSYQAFFPQLLLHFLDLDSLESFLRDSKELPWGISLGEEAEEEPQLLDYERIDEIMAIFSDVHL
jgi:hypothetical protein